GRYIEPAGVQIATETLPLNLALTPDGTRLLVTNDGYRDTEYKQFVQVVDTATLAVSKVEVPHFFGLAVTPDGDPVFFANDANPDADRLESLRLINGSLVRDDTPLATLPHETFPTGLALSADGSHLFAVGLRTNAFVSIDLASGTVYPADTQVGNLPYSVVAS